MRVTKVASAALATCMAVTANAAITATNFQPAGPFAGFPLQNPAAPTGPAYQANYPYPGQCVADGANQALFPTLPLCSARATSSFSCTVAGHSNRSADGWAACGAPVPFVEVAPVLSTGQQKFTWEVLNPPDYTPDTATFPGADYYEIGLHEAWGFQTLAGLGAFPNPKAGRCSISQALCDPAAIAPAAGSCPATAGTCNPIFPTAPAVPNGMQWTGLMCQPVAPAAGCTCPADASAAFKAAYCSAGGLIPAGAPLYTPIWGVGQINAGGTLGVKLGTTAAQWSPTNNYIATWPSISIRGTKGKPVVVKWTNEFPNNHVLCPHPDAADWPCSIDRTFMGVKARIDPAASPFGTIGTASSIAFAEGVNEFGSPQQPDNSWVTHLHGGEIPPSTDGFAEKWFGNSESAKVYSPSAKLVNPPFENPSGVALFRPAGNFDTYTYPMVQEEATIWFHDHTLGKTHHNVIAGPAGFFPVKEPLKHGAVAAGKCTAAAGQTCDYTWLDPVTEPRGAFGMPKYDLFLAIQDRAFNDDGSINFSNGLGQTVVQPPLAPLVPGNTSITPGVNPLVHPTWLPEYFGDHALVNGVLWPKKTTEPGWYRLRLVDGSDSRCWTIGFSTVQPLPGTKPNNNVNFYVIANDQGYLKTPVLAPGRQITMCPGERYELLVDFGKIANLPANSAATVFMTNTAAAPFPAGITPFAAGSPFADLNVVMRFDVSPANGPGVKSCGTVGAPASLTWDPAAPNMATACMPPNPSLALPVGVPTTTDPGYADLRPTVFPVVPGTTTFNDGKTLPTVVRQVYLNERLDGVTLAPLGMQLNGVPFEYKVTETPRAGSREIWQFVNLTVDAHPMHPHLIRHQIVARQPFNVGKYKALLCGSSTCQPGTSPGGEMQVIPDPTAALSGGPVLVTPASVEGGYKDAVQVPPGKVTTIVADWTARWPVAPTGTLPTAPGTAGCPSGTAGCPAPYTYEAVTSGPYVWHCHINSHEDSEMMRTSLVVP